MGVVDFLKAAVTAIGILVVNVAISFGAVATYSVFIDPGRKAAYYEAAAQWIAPLSSIAFGWILFFLAMLVMSNKPGRSALLFALVTFAVYAAIDLSLISAMGALSALGPTIAVSLASKLAGAVGGVWVAQRQVRTA
jgi:hypothetical protein